MRTSAANLGRIALITALALGGLQFAVAPASASCILSCYSWCNDNWHPLWPSLQDCRDACVENCGV